MAEFTAADAAFTGFRLVWERPLSVLYWAALQLVAALGYVLFVTLSAGKAFTNAAQVSLQFNADPGPLMAALAPIAPTYLVVILAFLVLSAVLYAAMNRAVLRPERSSFGYLRLASDELRQLGLLALLAGMAIALYFAIVLAAAVVLTLLALVVGDIGMVLGLVVVVPMTLVAFIYFGVRFSLASPMTFDRGRVDVLGSWRLTRGRFWPLFVAYLLAFALSLVVWALTIAIAIFAVAILGGGFGAIAQGAEENFDSLAAAFTPARGLYLTVAAAGTALRLPITLTPPATIYRALTGAAAGRAFD